MSSIPVKIQTLLLKHFDFYIQTITPARTKEIKDIATRIRNVPNLDKTVMADADKLYKLLEAIKQNNTPLTNELDKLIKTLNAHWDVDMKKRLADLKTNTFKNTDAELKNRIQRILPSCERHRELTNQLLNFCKSSKKCPAICTYLRQEAQTYNFIHS